MSCGTSGASESTTTPLTMVSKNPRECWPGQMLMDERELAEVQPPWGEFPAHHWRKKRFGCIGHYKRNFTRATSFLPKATLHGAEKTGGGNLSWRGKGEQWVRGWLPQCCRTQLEKPVSLHQHPEYLGGTSATCWRAIRKRQLRISKGIKGMWFLLSMPRTSAESLPTSF